MKWLFSLLVLANIALLIWGIQRERAVPEVSTQESAGVGEMRLLSESRYIEAQPPVDPVEEMSTDTAAVTPGEEESRSDTRAQEPEPEPVSLEQAGADTTEEAVSDPGQAMAQPDTEVVEQIEESGQTEQISEATPADAPMEAVTVTETQESPEVTEVDQPPAASPEPEPEPAAVSETPPEEIASGSAVQEEQSVDSAENVAEVEEGNVEQVPTEEIPVQEELYCGAVGPLEEEAQANKLLGELGEREMDPVLRKETVQKAAGFWVIIPPYATRQEARAEEGRLANAGVKDYRRFYRGEFKNGISLGIYSRRRNAEIRKTAIEAKGFSPEVVPRTRRITEFWLDYKADLANKEGNLSWLAENYPKLGAEERGCSLD